MRILLDSHAFLWYAADSPELSAASLAAINDPANVVFVSVASLWEIAIKESLGKLKIIDLEELLRRLDDEDFQLLSVGTSHVRRIRALPFHHRDPFDRMLVAQALEEQLCFISCDAILDLYGIDRLW